MNVNENKTVAAWITDAEEYFKGANALFNLNPDGFKHLVCFSAQQSVEKYLKSYLLLNGAEIDDKFKIHDIGILIDKCKEIDTSFDNLYKLNADTITKYAVRLRYPSASTSNAISIEEEKTVISITEKVKSFVVEKILEKQKELKEQKDHDKNIIEPVMSEKESIKNNPDIKPTETIKRKFRR